MKILSILLLILSILIVSACNTVEATPTPTADVMILLTVEPDPPTAGESMLMFVVRDTDGNPIEDASVAVHGDMDHEGMIPVDGREHRWRKRDVSRAI